MSKTYFENRTFLWKLTFVSVVAISYLLIVLMCSHALQVLTPLPGDDDLSDAFRRFGLIPILSAMGITIVPEELLFRLIPVMIFRKSEDDSLKWVVILLSSALFGYIHVLTYGVSEALAHFVFGVQFVHSLILFWIFLYAGGRESLWRGLRWSWYSHFIYNVTFFYLVHASQSI